MPDETDDVEILERDEDIVDDLDEEDYEEPQTNYQENIEDLKQPAPVKVIKTSEPKKSIKKIAKKVKVKVQPKKKVKTTKANKVGKKQAVRHKKLQKENKRLIKKLEKKAPVKHKDHKDKKDKKHGKRGPKGAQSPNWTMPYQPSSTLHKAFELCTKKGGIKLKELVKAIKKFGGKPSWVITQLKLGHSLGWVWEVDDSNDRLRLLHWKNMSKKIRKH